MTYLLAQDIGTSSAKAALFTSDGVLVRSCSTFYDVQRPAPNWAQQNAEVWWDAFCENNHKLLDGLDISCLAAISVSGQMMGCLPIDTTGSPLYPSIIWEDGRALEQAKKNRKNLWRRCILSYHRNAYQRKLCFAKNYVAKGNAA